MMDVASICLNEKCQPGRMPTRTYLRVLSYFAWCTEYMFVVGVCCLLLDRRMVLWVCWCRCSCHAWLWLCIRCGLVSVQVVQQWCRSVGRCFLSLWWIGV